MDLSRSHHTLDQAQRQLAAACDAYAIAAARRDAAVAALALHRDLDAVVAVAFVIAQRNHTPFDQTQFELAINARDQAHIVYRAAEQALALAGVALDEATRALESAQRAA